MRLDIDRQDVHVLVQDIEQVGAHFSHSKDPTIKKILQSDSITLLSTFEKKRLFIQQLLGQIRTGSDEGMWESFFEVYRSMKTHISKIRNDFGDVVLADDLLHCYEDKATFGEQPLVWQKKFESIVRTLQDSATVRRLFFEASVTHLLRPLTARIDERVIEHHSQLQSAVSRSGGLKKKISRKGVRDLLIYLRQVERFYLAKIDSLKVLFTTRKQHLNALVTQFKETYTGEFNEESFLKKADLIIGDGMDVQEEIAKFSSTRDRFSVDDDRYRMQLIPAALQIATAVVAGNNRIAQGSLDMLEEGKDIVLLKDQASSISTELSQLVDDLDQTLGDGRERIRRWIDG